MTDGKAKNKPQLGAIRLRDIEPGAHVRAKLALTIGDTTWFCRDRQHAQNVLELVAGWNGAPLPPLPPIKGTYS